MDQKDTIQSISQKVSASGAVMLYFYSDSCAPCLQLRPKVDQLIQGQFPDMELIKINAETEGELAAAYSAFSLPVLIVFFGGKEFFRYSKYVSIGEMQRDIGRIYRIYFT